MALPSFDSPTNAVRENGTYGDEVKAVGRVPPTALLFEQAGLGCLSTVRRINAGNGWLDWQGWDVLRAGGHHARNNSNADPGWSSFYWGVQPFAGTAHSACAMAPVCTNHSGMHAGWLCSLRRQDGCWDRGGLYQADYGRDATTKAGHQAFAATRPAGRSGMQGAKSEFRNGWRATLVRV